MKQLTDRQQLVFDYIKYHMERKGYSPTIREIGNHMKIASTNGVVDHLWRLRAKGYIDWDDGKCRTIRITNGN